MNQETTRVRPGQELTGKNGIYPVEAPLGEGGFGVTFLARRKQDDQKVVLKLLKLERALDWKAVELFEREAEVLRGLSHPNIPRYLDSFSLGDPNVPTGFALIQSFVPGKTLKEVMRQRERLSPEEMFRWFWDMLEVCQYLHSQNPPVIHRDINPKNIILGPEGAVLIDFGTVQAKVTSQYSVSSTSAGTFGYAPLEQFVGRASPSSDLYGLAMTFLAVATGREPEALPFAGNRVDVRSALSSTQTDARIILALDRMTQPDPDRRPASALEVMVGLEALRRLYKKVSPQEQAASAPRAGAAGQGPAPRAAVCPQCQKPASEEDRFCADCGFDLKARPAPSAEQAEPPRPTPPGAGAQDDSSFTVCLRYLGESVPEAKITLIRMEKGERVTKEQVLLVVDSDKATFEITSPKDGVIQEIHVRVGDVVPVGAPLFTLSESPQAPALPVKPEASSEEVEALSALAPRFRMEYWKEVKACLSQIPPGTHFGARPGIPLGEIEHVAFDDAGTRALLVTYECCYLFDLREMRTRRLVSHEITSRRGAFSADGRALLIADYYSEILYFVDLPPEKDPVVRAVACPELKELDSDLSVAVSPDHQLAALGAVHGDGSLVLLVDWESAEVSNRLTLPWDTTPGLLFSPDGSTLFCYGDQRTWCFDAGGGKQTLPSSHRAISPDGKSEAFVMHHKDGERELVLKTAPYPKPFRVDLPRHKNSEAEVEGLRFSPDGKLLGVIARLSGQSGANVQIILVEVSSGKIVGQIREPYFPGRSFGRVEGFAFAEDGRLLVFAEGHPSRYIGEATMALFLFSPYPDLRYLGAVQAVKRNAEGAGGGSGVFIRGREVSAAQVEAMGIVVTRKEQNTEVNRALAQFAGPPGDPDPTLPFGETSFGFFGRLDVEQPIGAAGWVAPFERPEVVRRALLGEEEESLLEPGDRLRRFDLEARQSFWQALRAEGRFKGGIRALVEASCGLSHLLPAVLSHAEKSTQAKKRFGGSDRKAALSEGLLIKACQEISGYSEAEREVLFEEMGPLLEKEAREHARKEMRRRFRGEAEELEKQAEETSSTTKRRAFLGKAAEIYQEKLNDKQKAISLWRKLLAEDESDLRARAALEALYEAQGDWSPLAHSLSVRAHYTKDPRQVADILYRRGKILEEKLSKPQAAIKAYREALENDPERAEILDILERLYDQQPNFLEFRDFLIWLTGKARGKVRVPALLKLARLSEERWRTPADALRYFKEALDSDPGSEEAAEGAFHILAREERWPELITLMNWRLPFLSPEGAIEARLRIARIQEEECGDRGAAIATYYQILEQAPGHPEALSAIERLRQMQAAFLQGELRELGVSLEEYELLLMLPLFEVAWADGKLQKKEAQAIMEVARQRNLLRQDGQHPVLARWSAEPLPTELFEKARKLLVTLADDVDYPEITREKLSEIVLLCREIASASGGFLGFGRLSGAEKEILSRIEADLASK